MGILIPAGICLIGCLLFLSLPFLLMILAIIGGIRRARRQDYLLSLQHQHTMLMLQLHLQRSQLPQQPKLLPPTEKKKP